MIRSMFRFQHQLPKLPVPELKETCQLYLQSIRPHATPAEFQKTQAAVSEFLAPNSMGHLLQKRLLERAAAKKDSSWLIEWWNDYAYMSYRDPIVIWVSYFFVFNDDPVFKTPAARAASLVKGAMEFKKMVVEETLEPDMSKKNALCMDMYRYMFNSTRIPALPSDTTRTCDPRKNTHILVIRKNQFFTFDLEVNGKPLSMVEIEQQFKRIVQQAGKSKGPAVGAFTTEHRDEWAKIRKRLLEVSPKNKQSLDKIERAAFAVCLDDTSPVTREEASRACWHGDGQNRFFDKPLQFIVFENGKAGFNGEHSMMDGTPTHRLCDFVLEGLKNKTIDLGSSTVGNIPQPEKLEFDLDSGLEKSVTVAIQKFNDLIKTQDVKVTVFEEYGKNQIKKMKLSPDGYAQMAIQLAYYKTYGKCVPTYESAQTRKFGFGRTETCRSCSVESVEWVKAMQDSSLSLKVKGELGRKAIQAQTAYMAKAVEGNGVDRHLLGLRLLIKPEEQKPSLFTDAMYSRTCHWTLSTSQITSEHFDGYGWGEVVPDGYGIAYMVKDNSLHFNLACQWLGADRLRDNFMKALKEMRQVFEATIPEPKSKL